MNISFGSKVSEDKVHRLEKLGLTSQLELESSIPSVTLRAP